VTAATRFDEWGIRAAEQLEANVGAWIALASYKRLHDAPSPVRERAVLGALRCALELGDQAELLQAAERWSKSDPGYPTDEPVDLAMRQLSRGWDEAATRIADSDHARRSSAASAYAAARIFGGTKARRAATESALLGRARSMALAEGNAILASAVAARRLEMLEVDARQHADLPYRREALAIVEGVTLEGASDTVRLAVARAQLLSPGRFARAGALSALGDAVAAGGDVGHAAAGAIARHIDAMGVRLTALEAERALAGLGAIGDVPRRDEVLRRTRSVVALATAPSPDKASAARDAARGDAEAEELVVRARALAMGSPMASHGSDRFSNPFVMLAALGLDALGAMARDPPAMARAALVAAGRSIGPGEAIPAPLWTAVLTGLATRAGELREVSARLGAKLVRRAAGEPPSGFLVLGEALAAAGGEADAAREALDHAARAREPGAKEALTRTTTIAAWRAYDAGETARARALLLEARRAAATS